MQDNHTMEYYTATKISEILAYNNIDVPLAR